MATLNFNANDVEPSTGFSAIPAGKYAAVISDSEMKPNKAGTGQYLQLELEIIDGDYAGRRLWARLNLENPNQDAVRIARSELSAICRAVGVLTPSDSVELHNIPLTITVKCRKNQDDEIVNEIKGYEARQAAPKAAQTAASPGAAPVPPIQQPPWARK